MVVKGFPWIPTSVYDERTSLAREDLQQLQSLGFNMIRLGVMWPGLESRPGVWNHTYLEEVRKLIVEASRYGIYTLLDMHQDMMGPKFCGAGIVDWLANYSGWIQGFPRPIKLQPFNVDERGYPSDADCDSLQPWILGQFSYAVCHAFQDLYEEPGRTLWARAWWQIANATKDSPGLLGYELINEPSIGAITGNPLRWYLGWPPNSEAYNLQPAYDVVAKAIRSVAPDSLIFFEALLFTTPETGFEHAPGGKEFANRSVLTFHHYTLYGNWPTIEELVWARAIAADRLGTGLFASEIHRPCKGVLWPCEPLQDVDWKHRSKALDDYAIGWSLWELKPYCIKETGWGSCHRSGVGEVNYFVTQDGGPDVELQKAVSRPYASVVGGWLLTLRFDPETAIATIKLNVTEGETEIFLPRVWYPKPSDLRVASKPPVLRSRFDDQEFVLKLEPIGRFEGLVEVMVIPPAVSKTDFPPIPVSKADQFWPRSHLAFLCLNLFFAVIWYYYVPVILVVIVVFFCCVVRKMCASRAKRHGYERM